MDPKTSVGCNSTGHYSSGNYSSGNYSTGNNSTGDYSTGSHSTGDYSSGHYSTGDYSTGDWSISNYSSGHFSTKDYSGFEVFNKPCTLEAWMAAEKPNFLYFNLTVWVSSEDMSAQEKKNKPEHETIGGYLKNLEYKEAWRIAWDSATDKDKELLYALPNFDPEVFEEISGIDIKEVTKEITISEIQHLLGYKIKVVE